MSLETFFHKRSLVFLFLSILTILIYSNTFDASWHLDDRPNIVNNTYLHLESLHPDKLIKTFYTDHHNPEQLNERMYRPVACLSFALNWYAGQDNVFGYHVVNTAIHILTAFFLFLVISKLLTAPNLKDSGPANPAFIAFLASVLWAVHPIQTQAVTYIVQRMAQLAALFYILGLYAYLQARMTRRWKPRIIWYVSCLVFLLLGVNSKPNAVMMPLALVLVEVVFFRDLSDRKTRKTIILAGAAIAALVLLAGSVVFLKGEPLSFLDLYRTRTFSLAERLLTQPRVIVFYLSQIFFPTPDRFSIAHDVVLSSSLINPWTTLASLLTIISMVGFSILRIRKNPILAFSILFFFLNHVIESSVIALELVFEHRNYLPSFFIFLPVAVLLNDQLIVHQSKRRSLYALIVVLIISLVSFLSVSTFIRNRVWKDDVSLWMDAASKAPNNARAANILAIKLAWGDNSNHPNRFDMALKLFEGSLDKQLPSSYVKADIYNNMALITFHNKYDPQQAFHYFQEALTIHPENLKIRRNYVEALMLYKDFDAALEQVDILLSKKPDSGRYLSLKGHIFLWQEKYREALQLLKEAYPLSFDKTGIILDTAVCLSRLGDHSLAEQLIVEAIQTYPDNLVFYFVIIESSARAGDKIKTAQYAQILLQEHDKNKISQELENVSDNPRFPPVSKPVILSAIENE